MSVFKIESLAPGITVFGLSFMTPADFILCYMLPYIHAVALQRAVLAGDFSGIFPHIWWIAGYGAAALGAAVAVFLRQMRRQ